MLFDFVVVACNTTATTATNSSGQKLHVIQPEKTITTTSTDVAATQSQAGNRISDRSSEKIVKEVGAADVLHVLPCQRVAKVSGSWGGGWVAGCRARGRGQGSTSKTACQCYFNKKNENKTSKWSGGMESELWQSKNQHATWKKAKTNNKPTRG